METKQLSTECKLINRVIKDFWEFNENEHTANPNLRDTMKVMISDKFIALSAYVKKLERSHINILRANLKDLEQREVNTSKSSRWQEKIKQVWNQ